MAFNRDATWHVVNANDDTVTVYYTVDYHVATTIDVGDNPWGVTLNPDGSRLYVTNYFSDEISVIDPGSNQVVHTIEDVPDPLDVAFSPNGAYAYVTLKLRQRHRVGDRHLRVQRHRHGRGGRPPVAPPAVSPDCTRTSTLPTSAAPTCL